MYKLTYLLSVLFERLHHQDGVSFTNNVLNEIKYASKTREDLTKFFTKNYSVFNNDTDVTTREWSSKSYLNAISFLSILELTNDAKNIKWKLSVFYKFVSDFFDLLNKNINYFESQNIVDDWDTVKDDLKNATESETVEYKTTLGYHTQGKIDDLKNHKLIKEKKKAILEKIAKTILAMMNSHGGNIYIGIIENVEIIREDVKQKVVIEKGIYFLDVLYSLQQTSDDIDSITRSLQETLHAITNWRIDKLDSYFNLEKLQIYSEKNTEMINIIKIDVKKLNEGAIFIQKNNFITMPKRSSGRTETVAPTYSDFQ